jgi:hypothetical protein
VPVQMKADPWWAALTVWGVVNAVNVLQAAGFLSRVRTGSMAINHLLGYVMAALAVPAVVALAAFWSMSGPSSSALQHATGFLCPTSCFSLLRFC